LAGWPANWQAGLQIGRLACKLAGWPGKLAGWPVKLAGWPGKLAG